MPCLSHLKYFLTRCWYINVKEWEQPCERNPKQAEIKRFSHVTAQWGDSAAPWSKPRGKPDATLISNSCKSVRADGPEPDKHATCAANHRTSVRLREPQIDSKPPTLEAPLSVSALLSVNLWHYFTRGHAQNQCGLPTTLYSPQVGHGAAPIVLAS